MAEANPAEFIVLLLYAVRDGNVLRDDGVWEANKAEEGSFANALGLTGAGARNMIDAVTSTINVFDWLNREAGSFNPRKRDRYQNA